MLALQGTIDSDFHFVYFVCICWLIFARLNMSCCNILSNLYKLKTNKRIKKSQYIMLSSKLLNLFIHLEIFQAYIFYSCMFGDLEDITLYNLSSNLFLFILVYSCSRRILNKWIKK